MSICINNDLIWISVPKCASFSIEKSIMEHPDIKYKHIKDIKDFESEIRYNKDDHLHVSVDELKYYFGNLETVCIKRDWFDRWLSSLEYMWRTIKMNNLTPRYKYEEIDNELIYKIFTNEFVDKFPTEIYVEEYENLKELLSVFIMEPINNVIVNNIDFSCFIIMLSQNIWTKNEKCTYEFDITEIDKFEKFISNRYNINFKLKYFNKSEKLKNNIIINDELKNFVWNRFESKFVKNKTLI